MSYPNPGAYTAAGGLRLAYSARKGAKRLGWLQLAIGSHRPPTCLTCRWLFLAKIEWMVCVV